MSNNLSNKKEEEEEDELNANESKFEAQRQNLCVRTRESGVVGVGLSESPVIMVSSATLECFHQRLINQSQLHCGTVLCTVSGLRVRGDGCPELRGLSAKRGHNLESVGLSHFARRCVGRNRGNVARGWMLTSC